MPWCAGRAAPCSQLCQMDSSLLCLGALVSVRPLVAAEHRSPNPHASGVCCACAGVCGVASPCITKLRMAHLWYLSVLAPACSMPSLCYGVIYRTWVHLQLLHTAVGTRCCLFALAVPHTVVGCAGRGAIRAFFYATLVCTCAGPALAGTVELDRWRVIVSADLSAACWIVWLLWGWPQGNKHDTGCVQCWAFWAVNFLRVVRLDAPGSCLHACICRLMSSAKPHQGLAAVPGGMCQGGLLLQAAF